MGATESLDTLQHFMSPAVWAVVGVIVSKVVDWGIARSRDSVDVAAKTYSAVNVAQKQLTDGLFQQMKMLQEQMDTLKEQLVECEEKHNESTKRVDELEQELRMLQAQKSGAPPTPATPVSAAPAQIIAH